ncbi:MAG: hypothetical protein Harvfovirus37_12 [Harvfovirus sp.]|uniref:Uncharacterized protein n=1 Tax=Harvfovirus sp. TaxID=2487768 RepID=A0A3G5A2P6_9VIRU|nr:MAG: hypothetical protein Harvfovirus37_12 [Harvfovirus sp.]
MQSLTPPAAAVPDEPYIHIPKGVTMTLSNIDKKPGCTGNIHVAGGAHLILNNHETFDGANYVHVITGRVKVDDRGTLTCNDKWDLSDIITTETKINQKEELQKYLTKPFEIYTKNILNESPIYSLLVNNSVNMYCTHKKDRYCLVLGLTIIDPEKEKVVLDELFTDIKCFKIEKRFSTKEVNIINEEKKLITKRYKDCLALHLTYEGEDISLITNQLYNVLQKTAILVGVSTNFVAFTDYMCYHTLKELSKYVKPNVKITIKNPCNS